MTIYKSIFKLKSQKSLDLSATFTQLLRRSWHAQLLISMFIWAINANAETQDKIIFVHIPKTGGISVHSLLENEYHFDQTKNDNPEKILLPGVDHFTLFQIKKKRDISDFKLITFLRNPIDRVLSEHRYCMIKHRANPDILISHNLPPTGDPIETSSNNVCKQLSGLDAQNPLIPIEDHLRSAKEALSSLFFFVGITENMEESIHLLYSKLGWTMPKEVPHFNTTEKTPISPAILQGIIERNQADIELYEFALNLYKIQKDQIISSPKSIPYEENHFASHCLYTFDQKLKNGYGWAFREECCADYLYRWVTANNEAGIDFYLSPDNHYIIQFSAFIPPIFRNQLHLFVNGVEIPIHSRNMHGNRSLKYILLEYQGSISRDLIKKGEATTVVFKMLPPIDPYLNQIFQNTNPQQASERDYQIGKFGLYKIEISKP